MFGGYDGNYDGGGWEVSSHKEPVPEKIKEYVDLRSVKIEGLMKDKECISLDEFIENINIIKKDWTEAYKYHDLEFFIEEHWYSDFKIINFISKRLETDREYDHRVNTMDRIKKQNNLERLIRELKDLSKDDLTEVLESI